MIGPTTHTAEQHARRGHLRDFATIGGVHGLHRVMANFQGDDNVDRILAASSTHIEQYTASARRTQRTSPHPHS
ncbi:hypothetical protein AB0D91_44420 [Streptomyces canus]|uniref:hypothetical protein n=1 Tax=Streptomyces canus TaxID=58343 RepID=UPI0034114BB0